MKSVLAIGAFVAGVTAQQSLYGQCGGVGYTGPTSCSAGATCTLYNAYYAQCIPGAATTAVTTTKASTTPVRTTTTPIQTTTSVKPTTTPSTTVKTTTTSVKPTTTPVTTSKSTTSATKTSSVSSGTRPSGFPYASGTNFYLDGKKFFFAGSNAYFIPMYGPNDTGDMDAALDAFAATGMKVLRTWAFADFVGPQQDYVTVFQNWSTVPPQILTTQEVGLPRLDYVVAGAEKRGIKLILPFTNNWGDYGGMELYVTSVLGSSGTHGDFYSNAVIKQYYKNYVNAVVSRYKNSPAIFAWELMNEPRCGGSKLSSGTCSISLINSWASEMSAYVKSLDPWHMVAIGDEGFINNPGNSDYMYSGGAGIDNQALTALPTIDFGTFHMYPSSWSETWEWGNKWILDHANISKILNKPYILEEYAVTRSSGVRDQYMAEYHNTTFNSIIAGDMFWQFGTTVPNWGKSYDDGNSIYPEDSDWQTLVIDWAAKMASKNN